MSKYTAGIQKLKAQKADLEEKINKLDQDIQTIQEEQYDNKCKYEGYKAAAYMLPIFAAIFYIILKSSRYYR